MTEIGTGWKPQPVSEGVGKKPCMLVYGVPGAMKTRLAGSSERPLIIRPPTDHTDALGSDSKAEEIVVRDWSKMLEVFQWGQQGGFKVYDWVWLDSLSLMQDFLLMDVLDDAITRKPTRAVEKGGLKIPEFGPDQGEYKINFDRIVKWVGDMVGLAKDGMFSFGVTCHPFEWYDPVKDEDVLAPWIQGKNMSPKICGYMNIVAYLQVVKREGQDPQRVLLTEAEGFYGKDQFNAFPELKSGRRGIIDPSMDKIDRAIKQSRRGSRPQRKKPKTRRRQAA